MATEGLVSFVCIDEVHFVEQSGRYFRPEFKDAVTFLGGLNKIAPRPFPCTMMSATARPKDIDTVTHLLGDVRPTVMHNEFSRSDTSFYCFITGRSSTSLLQRAKKHPQQSPQPQHIFFTHSRIKAEGGLRDAAEKLLAENRTLNGGPDSVAQAFVGTNGIMMKTAMMDNITNYASCDSEGTMLHPSMHRSIVTGDDVDNGNDGVKLPKVQFIIATKAAKAGVNGHCREHGKLDGFPASMYQLAQMLGRVNRKGTADPGSNTYEVHVNANSYASLFVWTMRIPDADERRAQLQSLHDVLSFLVAPSECYHSCIEKYLSGCHCQRQHVEHVAHSIVETPLTSQNELLRTVSSLFSSFSFTKSMKIYKDQLFHPQDVPKGPMAQFHALAPQLVAMGMITLKVKDNKPIGTDKL